LEEWKTGSKVKELAEGDHHSWGQASSPRTSGEVGEDLERQVKERLGQGIEDRSPINQKKR